MMDNSGVVKVGLCVMALSLFATNVRAQEEAADAKAENAEEQVKVFEPLVRIASIRGVCEVNNPDVKQFAPAVQNKAYPMGAAFRTGDGTATLIFSMKDTLNLGTNTEVIVSACTKNPDARVVRLLYGSFKTDLRDNLPDGAFNVITENANCLSLSGRGEYLVQKDGELDILQVATITGSTRIEGPQYVIPALRAANTVNIQTSPGRSLSRLTSVYGDFGIELENGLEEPQAYTMTPKSVVKIWREKAPVGGRTVVSVLAVNHVGTAQHRFAYVVGRPVLATGDLVDPDRLADAEAEDEKLQALLSDEKPAAEKGKPAAEKEKPAAEKKETPAAEDADDDK
ncbi:MAG: hypothetical protein J6334_02590 [Kiritimatiellae bacterium]|nr:hypothetical protein [Kiritimatiellia bacterium]